MTLLAAQRVLVIHSGGDSQRLPSQSVGGKAWSLMAVEADGLSGAGLLAPIDHLLAGLQRICAGAPPGVFVACSDVLLQLEPPAAFRYDWSRPGVTGLAVLAPLHYGPHHGVYAVEAGARARCTHSACAPSHTPGRCWAAGRVTRFLQKARLEALEAAGAVVRGDGGGGSDGTPQVYVDTGVVFLDASCTRALAAAHLAPPLSAGTFLGSDAGLPPLRTELYSDFMLALGGGMGTARDAFIASGDAPDPTAAAALRAARRLLWDALSGAQLHVIACGAAARFAHVGTTPEYVQLLVRARPAPSRARAWL